MKKVYPLRSSSVLLSSVVSMMFVPVAVAQDEIDIPIPDPNLAITEDARNKEAEVKAEAERKIAQEKAAKKAAEELKKRQEEARAAGLKIEKEEVTSSHLIKAGSSLSLISAKAYARPGYWRILKLHNGIAPEKLQAGQVIKAPSIKWLLNDSHFSVMYPDVSKDLMQARKIFMDVEDKLEDSIKDDVIKPTEEDKKQIELAIGLINKCRITLQAKRDGVKRSPSAAIQQLLSAAKRMKDISKGSDKATISQNIVHEHLSNSIVYAVLWSKDGFK